VSGRAEALQRIDDALAHLGAIESSLRAAQRGQAPGIDRDDVGRRFRAIAHAGAGHHAFAPVQELAALAEKVADATDRSPLHSERDIEVVQHATDVLSLLLRDMGHQLLGRRGADVAPAAGALRERLEHMLLAGRRP
jgi:hypothetical protein